MGGRRAAGKGTPANAPLTEGPSGPSGPSGPNRATGRSGRRQRKQRRRRKTLKILGLSTAGVVVVAGSGLGYLYFHLLGNIKTAPLYTGTDKAAAVGVEKPDAFGRTPLNILLIGSDTRDTSADAKLGGDAGGGANADVEMVVHLSADRSNITVMSIPRDTVTQLPSCANEAVEQITSSLQYGPSCTAEAVHKLTGITIDDYAMVDFSGVVNISNALGGVDVCVSSNVYDVYSGLKLSKGTHSLEGKAALEFLRTRHAFGNGSDSSGRTDATHIFFIDMINKLKDSNTLENPLAMYKIADAATKALTVSPDLDSASKLISLADDLNKVPANRITFTTMQNVAYNGPDMSQFGEDVMEDTSQAPALFNSIINDQPLTSAGGKSTGAGTAPTATAAPAPPVSAITVAVHNGTSVDGRANVIASVLTGDGFNPATAGYSDTASPATTTLTYGPGQAAEAKETASILGLPSQDLEQGTSSGLSLVIGADWTSGNSFPNSKPSAAPVNTAAALSGTADRTAGQTNSCVQVGDQYTEPGNTPQSEYANNPRVPNSAP